MVIACGAPALAQSPTVAQLARAEGVDEVSTRGLWEERRVRLKERDSPAQRRSEWATEWLGATVVHGGNGGWRWMEETPAALGGSVGGEASLNR
jgi:hypothetical protein